MEPPRDASEAELSWRLRLCTMFPWRFALRSLVFVAILVGVCAIGRSWYAVLAGPVFLIVCSPLVMAWVMPFDYWLGPAGVTLKNWLGAASRRWSEFRGWRVEDSTVQLLFWAPPVREPFALLTWRNLDEVIAYVEGHLPKPGGEAQADER